MVKIKPIAYACRAYQCGFKSHPQLNYNMTEKHVVDCIVKYGDKILIAKRSDRVGYFPGKWHVISGLVETDDPYEDAVRELYEETGIGREDLEYVGEAEDIVLRKPDVTIYIHPYVFRSMTDAVTLNWENDGYAWVRREELPAYDTIPEAMELLESAIGMAYG